jgi:hypothetical protein
MVAWSDMSRGVPVEHLGHLSHTGNVSHSFAAFSDSWHLLGAVVVHSLSYLSVLALIALLVYEKLGLALLQRTWFNLDFLWVAVLMMSGIMILFL